MRAGGGHNKGANFERQIARSLSLWVSGWQRDDIYWRTAMSGGRSTIGLEKGLARTAQAGDLGIVDKMGCALLDHVVIELKHYKELDFFRGIVNDAGYLYGFWQDLKIHSAKFAKHPMLIARQNNMPIICLLPINIAMALFKLDETYASAILPRWECGIFLFDVFLREAQVPELDLPLVKTARRRFVNV